MSNIFEIIYIRVRYIRGLLYYEISRNRAWTARWALCLTYTCRTALPISGGLATTGECGTAVRPTRHIARPALTILAYTVLVCSVEA